MENKKNETTTPLHLSKYSKDTLNLALSELTKFHNQLTTKGEEIKSKTEEIKNRFNAIRQSTDVQATSDVGIIFEKASEDYAALIQQALSELDSYSQFYTQYLTDTSPQLKEIAEKAPQYIEQHIEQQIKLLKKYLKRREKEFAVFFSRFDHGFDNHLKRIQSIENYLQQKQSKK